MRRFHLYGQMYPVRHLLAGGMRNLSQEGRDIHCCTGVGQIQSFVQAADGRKTPLNGVECSAGLGGFFTSDLDADQRLQRLERVFHAVVDFLAQDFGIGQRLVQFDLPHRLPRQNLKSTPLKVVQLVRFSVEHAQGTKRQVPVVFQQRAGVKPDRVVAGDEIIVSCARVDGGVVHLEVIIPRNGMGANAIGDVAAVNL